MSGNGKAGERGASMWQIDAFTDSAFKGNPAAVCLFEKEPDPALMQSIAAEMNLSETAFLWPLKKRARPARFGLRWFTPVAEVPLCGHGTLAAAAALFRECGLKEPGVVFETRSGILRARDKDGVIEIDLPAHRCRKVAVPDAVVKAMGLGAVEEAWISPAGQNLLLRLPEETAVREARPDFRRLKEIRIEGVDGVMLTAKGVEPYDFVSRYFTPWYGIDEDPVTGSAHSMLAPYWAKILKQQTFFAHQASARGGDLHVRLAGKRVYLSGQTVTVLSGTLRV